MLEFCLILKINRSTVAKVTATAVTAATAAAAAHLGLSGGGFIIRAGMRVYMDDGRWVGGNANSSKVKKKKSGVWLGQVANDTHTHTYIYTYT